MARGYNGFESITIEAQQEDGKWCVRNAFNHQNAEVMTGNKTREWLIRYATSILIAWRSFDNKPLRLSGIPKYKGGYDDG